MRVTSEMMVTNSLRRLSTRLESYERIQTQLATGKRSAAPSNDPSSAGRALSLRASMRAREQESRNTADAHSWLDITDSQLQAGMTRLHRARDIAVRGATSTDTGERNALAEELRGIQAELKSIANAEHSGRPLFAGAHGTPPISEDGAGNWTVGPVDGQVLRRVGDSDLVQVNVAADAVFGFRPGDGGDLFNDLERLIEALQSGDTAGVSTGIARMDAAQTRVNDALAKTGAATNRVDSARQRSIDTLHAIRTELSQVEDVDIAEAIMNLQVEETAYQATLQALARALPPSLASFLR